MVHRDAGLWFGTVADPDGGLRYRRGGTEFAGHYPSTCASGELAIWFKGSEGDLIGLGQYIY